MNNNRAKTLKIQDLRQAVLCLCGEKAIKQLVSDLRKEFNIRNRDFNKSDFYRICKAEKIHVENSLKLTTAFNYTVRQKSYIALSNDLSEAEFLEYGFHELGHHFLHRHNLHRQKHSFREGQPSLKSLVREAQADLFAELLLGGICNNG